ncbi:MAG: response regulator [Phycisphaerales bacterium]|nr:response regulator [Phycisphaerales bacterium]
MANAHTRPVRFLLIEDDEDHAFLIRRAMQENRVTNALDHVADGEAALRFLRKSEPYEHAKRPDVILLDLNLPKLDGQEVLNAIKADAELNTIPVVVLTTSSAEADRVRAYSSGVNSYVVKPVDFLQFRRAIQDLQMYWAVLNEPAMG